ncbi:MAG: VWA domain-containing protein [Acidobacteriota bacterium]
MIRFVVVILLWVLGLCLPGAAQDRAESSQKPSEQGSVSYGLVVDNSGSFRTLLDNVITVVSDVVEENGADDEAFLVTFVDTPKIVLRQEFTYRKSELHDAAQNMFIEGGKTAILDAIKSSADYLVQNARTDTGRIRALVLVTDGEDRESASKIEDVQKLLKDQNIRLFVIAMSDTRVFTKILDRLTKGTGGLIVAPKGRAGLSAAAKQIFAAMRTK